MRCLLVSVLLISISLMAAVPAVAKPRHWYTDKKWWVGLAVIGASVGADMLSTSQRIQQGGVETNQVFLGPRPSTGRLVGVGIAAFTFYGGMHAAAWHVERNDTKPWRAASLIAIPAVAASVHGTAAAKNFSHD